MAVRPITPVITSPSSFSQVPNGTMTAITYTYSHPDSTKTLAGVRIKHTDMLGGNVQWWNGTAWQNTTFTLTSSALSQTLYLGYNAVTGTGSLVPWIITVETQDSAGTYSWPSQPIAVTGIDPPVVTVLTPAANQTSPVIGWTYDPGTVVSGATISYIEQKKVRVAVYSSAVYSGGGFTPFVTPGAVWQQDWMIAYGVFQAQVTEMLTNGTTYKAYVQIETDGGYLTTVASSAAWTASFSAFAVVGTFTATVNNSLGTVALAASTGAAATRNFAIDRSEDAGVTWTPVQGFGWGGGAPETAAAPWTMSDHDRFAPQGVSYTNVRYRIQAVSGTSRSAYTTVSVTGGNLIGSGWWVRDPLLPARDLKISQMSFSGEYSNDTDEFMPDGRTEAVVINSNAPQAVKFSLDAVILTNAEFDALMLLLRSKRTLVVQSMNNGLRWYVKPTDNIKFEQTMAKGDGTTSVFKPMYKVSCTMLQVAPIKSVSTWSAGTRSYTEI